MRYSQKKNSTCMTHPIKHKKLEEHLTSVENDLLWQVEVNASIAELTNKLIIPNSIENISSLILGQAKYLTDSYCGYAGYFKPQTGNFAYFSVSDGDPDESASSKKGPIFKTHSGPPVRALKSRKSLMTNRPTKATESLTMLLGCVPIRRFLSAPALIEGKLVGQIGLANSSHDYTEKELVLVKRLAVFYALAIQRYWLDEALHKAHENLEAKVKARTNQLIKANESLQLEIVIRKQVEEELKKAKIGAENANRAKSNFLANMSHELRTPLNHIIGFTELVLDRNCGELTAKQEEFLNDVLQSSNHLLSLINDILDLSKIEAGKLELQYKKVNLKMLLENSLIMIKEKALNHSLQLSLDMDGIPHKIDADETKFKQIMYNLLSNAVKFTPDGGKVIVTAQTRDLKDEENQSAHNPQRTGVKISISDSGIGLKIEDLERVFKPFEQTDCSKSRPYSGTGLGLSITKQLVELHGGRIWVESEGEGKGCTFSFIIPVRI